MKPWEAFSVIYAQFDASAFVMKFIYLGSFSELSKFALCFYARSTFEMVFFVLTGRSFAHVIALTF